MNSCWAMGARAWVGLALAVLVAWMGQPVYGQAGDEPLARGVTDDSPRMTLAGNVPPVARQLRGSASDVGPVEDGFAVERLLLVLKRPAGREQALEQFLREAHTPGTESYRKWVTPEEFGRRFGAADSDVAAAAAWLESHGFAVGKVHPGRIAIEFSGNAGQLRAAFQTEIHRFQARNGKTGEFAMEYANVRDPSIPAALAGLVAGVSALNSFHARPLIRVMGKTSYNARTHEAKAEWTYPAANIYELSPGDFAVQYDIAPVYKAGTTGVGQSIGVVSASNVDLSLVAAYQKLFGLAANLPTVVVDGNDPGQNDAATEAYLDVEEAGAVAPGAKVILYTSAGSVVSDPLLTSALRALDDNQASVMSMSYGTCEAALGAAQNAAWALLWQEAAAQGITGFVSAGDGGSAGCDNFDTQSFAESGLQVNGLGSTPYNVSVGGTDFYFSSYGAAASTLDAQIATYWSSTSSDTPAVSLLQAAPEQVWNDAFGYNTTDAGLYSAADSTIVAGGGGASSAAVYPAAGPVAGYPKPSWQTGAGVPADKARDVPDLSLFASGGANYVSYPICAFAGDCVNLGGNGAVEITSVGGTSASAPAMAGIQALVNQAAKSRQGQANYVYYALANKTLTAKPFRDITVGGNETPCYAGTANCLLWTTGQAKGNYAESGYLAAAGYDRASGLGTVDVANLIANWAAATFRPSTTTLSVTPAVFAHGTTVAVKTTVAAASGTGTPTGTVGLTSNDAVAYANGLGLVPLSSGTGTVSLNDLPGGTYQVLGDYSGDGAFAASVSAPVTVTVTAEKDTLNTSGWVVNPVDGNLYPLAAGMSVPYGAPVYVDTQPVGVNETKPTPGQNTPATGAIAFTDKVGTATTTATVPLNVVGLAEWAPTALAVGSHTISASYTGDASYAASTAATAATLTVFKGTTTIYVQPMETSVAAGSNVTVDLVLFSDYVNLNGALPTGTVTVTLGGQTQTVASPFKSYGTTGSATEEVVVTFTKVPAGILPLTASYSGDANWNGTQSLFGSVQSLASLPAPAVTLTAATNTYTPSQTVTMIGTVTGVAGKPAPTGLLYFTWEDGNAYYDYPLQTKTASSSAWTLTFPAWKLANGSNTFVATFYGDANYSAQSSSPLTITLNGSDFSLTTATQEVAATPGKPGVATVLVTPIDGYSGTVTVSCSAPSGITCVPAVGAPTVGAGITDNLTVNVASAVVAGTYPAVVTATGAGHMHTAQILVTYTPVAATPGFTPAAGTYTAAQSVTISDATAGAALYYTTDGTTPTAASTVYTGPISVKATTTLKALAAATGYTASAVGTAVYTVNLTAATPSFSPAGGTFTSAQTVTISDATAGAAVYYTTDGTTPTAASTQYTAPVAVKATETIKAIAVATGYANSAVGTAAYTINTSGQAAGVPSFSPAGGTYFEAQTVTITDATPGAALYYTLNGGPPTVDSTLYRGPVAISTSETLRAIAASSGGESSDVATAVYTLDVATPTISPASGAYRQPISVTMTTTTDSARIFYTTDGATPTASSTLYTGPITVAASETIRAVALRTGFTASAVVEADYTAVSTTARRGSGPMPAEPR